MKQTSSFFHLKALTGSLLVGSLFAASASGTTILSERFLDGERLVQNLPNTSAWYGGGETSLTQTAGGSIVSTTSTTFLTYFTDSGTVSLAVGEIMTVSFDFQVPNPPASGFVNSGIRVGVMNSTTGVGRVTAEGFGNSNAAFVGYTGYGGWIAPQIADTRLRERTDMTSTALLGTNGVWPNRNTNTADITTILADTTYTGVFLISREETDRVVASFSVSGPNFATATATWNNGSLYDFDTFGIWTNARDVGPAFILSSVDITVIPEPSAYAAAAGLFAAAVLLFRRRRGGQS
jgi:hypothetical protein